MPKTPECKCNWGFTLVALLLGTLGIFLLAGGFIAQFNGKLDYWTVLAWYFAGLLILFLAKIAKWKACGCCTMHTKK